MRNLIAGIFIFIAISAAAVEYPFPTTDSNVLRVHNAIYNDTELTDTNVKYVNWTEQYGDTMTVNMVIIISDTDKTRIQEIINQ